MAKSILRKAELQKQYMIKLHAKLVALLLMCPELVHSVEIRITSDICLQFSAHNVTEGFGWINFYSFESQERLAKKYELARDFAAGAITFFPQEIRV